jgi:hypothetical protein
MVRKKLRGIAPAAVLVFCVLAGCYETDQQVAPRESARVDARFVGDWEFRDPNAGATILLVRNFSDREYYLEWGDVGASERHRASAFVAEVGGASIAHVRELTADGTVPQKHFLLRAAITPDGRLTLRHLNDKYFENKDVTTSAKLRRVIEVGVADEAMYDEQVFTGTRVAK